MINYFKPNWEPIKEQWGGGGGEQWVVCFKDEVLSLGETTNNRIEFTFQKVKSIFSKVSTFFTVLETLRNERNNPFLIALTKKSKQYQV